MITPELINYVKGARAAGQGVDQIRATLISQGWPSSDISEALSQTSNPTNNPTSTYTPGTNIQETGRGSSVMKVVLVVVGIIVILGIIMTALSLMSARKSRDATLSLNNPYSTGVIPTPNEIPGSHSGLRFCGDWPANQQFFPIQSFVRGSSLPAGFPSDFPLPEGIRIIGQIQGVQKVYACWSIDVDDAFLELKEMDPPAGWIITGDFTPPEAQIYGPRTQRITAQRTHSGGVDFVFLQMEDQDGETLFDIDFKLGAM